MLGKFRLERTAGESAVAADGAGGIGLLCL